MPKRELGPETELAKIIIRYFKHEHYDVYQECPGAGGAADIVVTKGQVIGVVECKKTMNMELLEQSERWLKHAHFIWAATWYPRRGGNAWANRLLRHYGIGLLYAVNPENTYGDPVREEIKPQFRRKIDITFKESLRPQMMSGEYGVAGSNRAGRYTPFKATCEALLDTVRANPGVTLKDAISSIKTHYASNSAARVNLKKYIEENIVKGLTYRIEDGKFRLYDIKNAPVIQLQDGETESRD